MKGEEVLDWLKEPEQKKAWKPKHGETYWFIDGDSFAYYAVWSDIWLDNNRWLIGNCFASKAECEFERERCIVEAELKRYAEVHNKEPIRPEDFNQLKWFLLFNTDEYKIIPSVFRCLIRRGVLFTSEDVAHAAIKEIGKDRIKLFYFGIGKEKWINVETENKT